MLGRVYGLFTRLFNYLCGVYMVLRNMLNPGDYIKVKIIDINYIEKLMEQEIKCT
jgi:hypothetical protein